MKEMFIERQKNNSIIALRQDNNLKALFIEQNSNAPKPGDIYLGLVKNIVPGIKSAFLDIGWKKNAYLYLDKKFNNTDIKKGQYILVEIVKEDLNNKGPKVSSSINIPGRYVVLEKINNELSFSHKIKDTTFKDYIKQNLNKPSDIGIMIRTDALNVELDILNKEICVLYNIYKNIKKEASYKINPGLLWNSGGVLGRVLRDRVDKNLSKIYVDNKDDYNYIKEFLADYDIHKVDIILHDMDRSLLNYYSVEKNIYDLKNKQVELPCGGNIVIEKTEAMYTIDVNSAKNIKISNMKHTAVVTNIEAAKEISRQIILRNLSGIILVDFIDMNNKSDKDKVLNELKKGFEKDKNKAVTYPFTELNLVQIARRRRGKSIYEYIGEHCRYCSGEGIVLNFDYIKSTIKNKIISINENRTIESIFINIDIYYKDYIQKNTDDFIKEIKAEEKSVYIKYVNKENFLKVEPVIFKSQVEHEDIIRI